jgi:hypothetical protein
MGGRTNVAVIRAPLEKQWLFQRDRLLRFLDKFFEARIAAQRIPERQQFQCAITKAAWAVDDNVDEYDWTNFQLKIR